MRVPTLPFALSVLLTATSFAQQTVTLEFSGIVVDSGLTQGPFVGAQIGDSVDVSFDVVVPHTSSTATSAFYTVVQSSYLMQIGGLSDTASGPATLEFSISSNGGGPMVDVPMTPSTSAYLAFPSFLSNDFNPTSTDITLNAGSFTINQSVPISSVQDSGAGYLPIDITGLTISDSTGPGTTYCSPAAANSASATGAVMGLTGSLAVVDNSATLTASSMPAHSFGFFIVSPTQGLVMNPGGSSGHLCLSGSIGRYVGPGQIQQSSAAGVMSLGLDLTMTPTPSGFSSVAAGDTLNFQAWFRDAAPGGGATSNFTDAIEITFS